MLTSEVITTLARKHHTTELNIRREYVQHLFLSYLYRQPHADRLYFKGGTALRIIYNSPRFSEDLDFSTAHRDTSVIERLIIDTLIEVGREGISAEIEEAKTTSGGYLGILLFQHNRQSISVQIEISFRSQKKHGEVTTIVSDFIPPYTLVQLAHNALIAEKTQALLSRKKPRDFYDFYFILRGSLLPPEDRDCIKAVVRAFEQVDISFEKELKQFLPKNQWAIIRHFPNAFRREVVRFLH